MQSFRGSAGANLNLNKTLFNYKAKSKLKVIDAGDVDIAKSSSSSSTASSFMSKWTCLVCLSKHFDHVSICSVCGSSKPDGAKPPSSYLTASTLAATASPSSLLVVKNRYANMNQCKSAKQQFSTYLLSQLNSRYIDDNNNITNKKAQPSPDSSSIVASKLNAENEPGLRMTTNPYIRKWTCRNCNFANDSLKIVCLNCRWVKTNTNSVRSQSSLTNLGPTVSSVTTETTPSVVASETKEPSADNNFCASCKIPIKESSVPVIIYYIILKIKNKYGCNVFSLCHQKVNTIFTN